MSEKWLCASCTFENQGENVICEICFTEKASVAALLDIPDVEIWACSVCTYKNSCSRTNCEMCQNPQAPPAEMETEELKPVAEEKPVEGKDEVPPEGIIKIKEAKPVAEEKRSPEDDNRMETEENNDEEEENSPMMLNNETVENKEEDHRMEIEEVNEEEGSSDEEVDGWGDSDEINGDDDFGNDDDDDGFGNNDYDGNVKTPAKLVKVDSWADDGGEEWDDLNLEAEDMFPKISDIEVIEYKENQWLECYWTCGACDGPRNHPSRATCMACGSPNMDNVMAIIISGSSRPCPKCKNEIGEDLFSFHLEWCQPLKSDEELKNWNVNLPANSKQAMICVHEKGKKNHENNKKTLQEKLTRLGFNLDINIVLTYFEWSVPVIIHVFPKELIPHLLTDPYYRNQFETSTSHGCKDLNVRGGWETRMFDGIYDKATPTERVKYGCLNMNLDEKGCKPAYYYGDAYFRLHDATVRWRVTITSEDSSSSNCAAGTLKYPTDVLMRLPDPELKALCECVELVGKKKESTTKSNFTMSCYREAQIHGPINCARDVASFHVPTKYKDFEEKIQMFCVANQIKLVWFDL